MKDDRKQNTTDDVRQAQESAPDQGQQEVGRDKDQARRQIRETTDRENMARGARESRENDDQPRG